MKITLKPALIELVTLKHEVELRRRSNFHPYSVLPWQRCYNYTPARNLGGVTGITVSIYEDNCFCYCTPIDFGSKGQRSRS